MRFYPPVTAPWRFIPLSAESLAATAAGSAPEAFRKEVNRRRRRDALLAKAREFRRQAARAKADALRKRALRDRVARARTAS